MPCSPYCICLFLFLLVHTNLSCGWEKEKRKWVLFQVHMAIAMYCFRKSKIYSEYSVLVLIVLRINRINRSQSGWGFYHFLTCLLQLAVGISENYWTHLLNAKRQYINNVGKCSTGNFFKKKYFSANLLMFI